MTQGICLPHFCPFIMKQSHLQNRGKINTFQNLCISQSSNINSSRIYQIYFRESTFQNH
ncbi:hypothetical protein M153_7720002849 [Pseudoloma neurophilia]|uniref:Uncharacterized protein n=1 Tax=Pseudoloma neurophilia TaxID=146866 RepID=A0A0R0LW07_9MICR|nr:hypothetical protein M153_7720002849 [Pseudoloma neurophilia]